MFLQAENAADFRGDEKERHKLKGHVHIFFSLSLNIIQIVHENYFWLLSSFITSRLDLFLLQEMRTLTDPVRDFSTVKLPERTKCSIISSDDC